MFRSLLRNRSWIVATPRTTNAITKTELTGIGILRSYHHRACGYLAGLHSYRPRPEEEVHETETELQADFESFESAWDAIQLVPDELLNDFEDELWETQSKRFVYGTKRVSVIDQIENHADSTRKKARSNNDESKTVFRYLILNERPNLIQTAVEVPRVGAPYHHYCNNVEEDAVPENLVSRPPSPVSQTHLGGLAMTLPFWYDANGITYGDSDNPTAIPEDHHDSPPNCLLIGAGGCSLAHTLASNLFLEEYNHDRHQSSDRTNRKNNYDRTIKSINRPELTAVEACPEILRASQLWFGAGDDKEEKEIQEETKKKIMNLDTTTEPPFFDLICDTGESYLESLVKSLKHENNSSSRRRLPIDILIIDAEDGSAPPLSMRTPAFWNELVLPSLNPGSGAVVGVNSIGTESETFALVHTMREAFCGTTRCGGRTGYGNDYTVLVVDPPPEAKVTDRHKLIFALPSKTVAQSHMALGLTEDDLKGYVDVPDSWEQKIKTALRATLAES
uniref:Uncharacterized protein n=1 Tax=Corethron hystrix TaxID=216773 RepID=A0A6U5D686_9STRA|mmetsp:Transcript_10242/g.22730  ORF Transcript_10242/g.22730 Transcript_10242/m.22730 type:complete len:506 (+) Transcript_10242:55-1572(+)